MIVKKKKKKTNYTCAGRNLLQGLSEIYTRCSITFFFRSLLSERVYPVRIYAWQIYVCAYVIEREDRATPFLPSRTIREITYRHYLVHLEFPRWLLFTAFVLTFVSFISWLKKKFAQHFSPDIILHRQITDM